MNSRDSLAVIRALRGLHSGSRTLRCLLGIMAIYALPGCTAGDAGPADSHAGQPSAARKAVTSVEDLDGAAFDFNASIAKAPTVVLFTRSDCPISNRCAPEIARLYEGFHPQGVAFYLVYVDPRETPAVIRDHLKQFAYPCQALRDPAHSLVAHCQATVTPEAALFDRQGQIVYQGRINDQYAELGKAQIKPTTHDLADAIEALVSGRPIAVPRTKAVGCSIADVQQP